MANINLLPWREELRQRQRQDYLSVILASCVTAVLIMLAISSFYGSKINTQQQRNNYLTQETAILDQKIKELNELKTQKKDLEQRLRLIQELQLSRNLLTQLFNAMADIVPAGVYLTKVEKENRTLKVEGVSESNNRLAALVRNIDALDWLTNPSISRIKADDSRSAILSRFEMTVDIVEPGLVVTEQKGGSNGV